jgi:hypothetical protein
LKRWWATAEGELGSSNLPPNLQALHLFRIVDVSEAALQPQQGVLTCYDPYDGGAVDWQLLSSFTKLESLSYRRPEQLELADVCAAMQQLAKLSDLIVGLSNTLSQHSKVFKPCVACACVSPVSALKRPRVWLF